MAHGQKDNSAGRVAPAAGASGASRLAVLAGAALVVLATLAAYRNSLDGPFIFDDGPSIVENTTIRELWPIGPVLSPPREGQAVTGRPVVNLSFAVNYALGELDVQGYHVGNLAIHVLAALVLLGLVHQTLRLPSMPEPMTRS